MFSPVWHLKLRLGLLLSSWWRLGCKSHSAAWWYLASWASKWHFGNIADGWEVLNPKDSQSSWHLFVPVWEIFLLSTGGLASGTNYLLCLCLIRACLVHPLESRQSVTKIQKAAEERLLSASATSILNSWRSSPTSGPVAGGWHHPVFRWLLSASTTSFLNSWRSSPTSGGRWVTPSGIPVHIAPSFHVFLSVWLDSACRSFLLALNRVKYTISH
jgi:hypothetical protein